MIRRHIHRRKRTWLAGGALAVAALAAGAALYQARWVGAQQPHGGPAPAAGEEAPLRMTMEELHRQGGVPKGWRFLLPKGDAPAGREVYVKMECYACHVIKGEKFPAGSSREQGKGPELTGIGGAHPPEYFFEALLNPNRVIIQGSGYTDKQGLSTMPNYNDVMTLEEAVNLVAYLKSLTSPGEGHPAAPKDQKEAPQGGGHGGGMMRH